MTQVLPTQDLATREASLDDLLLAAGAQLWEAPDVARYKATELRKYPWSRFRLWLGLTRAGKTTYVYMQYVAMLLPALGVAYFGVDLKSTLAITLGYNLLVLICAAGVSVLCVFAFALLSDEILSHCYAQQWCCFNVDEHGTWTDRNGVKLALPDFAQALVSRISVLVKDARFRIYTFGPDPILEVLVPHERILRTRVVLIWDEHEKIVPAPTH